MKMKFVWRKLLSCCSSDSSSSVGSDHQWTCLSVCLCCGHTFSFDSSSICVPPLLSAGDVTMFIIHSCWDYCPHQYSSQDRVEEKREQERHISFLFPFLSLFFFYLPFDDAWEALATEHTLHCLHVCYILQLPTDFMLLLSGPFLEAFSCISHK